MTDTDVQERPMTRRDLATMGLEGLNKQKAGEIAVSRVAGGVSFATALEVMEFAKLMALADTAVPKVFRNNPGMCLAVTFQAVEWQMSPFQVANKAYVVNDRLGFESQLVHAVIEARAPLQHRLECEYEGEGPDRVCVVTGKFTNGDVREYRSPKFKDITPKNSPLWKSDPDQQQWYYSSRAWARKWTPDVLMGIYTREELQDNPRLGGREDEPAIIDGQTLHQRLTGADVSREEGHRPGHVESELDQIAAGGERKVVDASPAPEEADKPAQEAAHKRKAGKGGSGRAAAKSEAQDAPVPESGATEAASPSDETDFPAPPRNPKEYAAHAGRWMAAETDKQKLVDRWKSERKLRNDCGMTSEDLDPVMELYEHRKEQLS